jgi:CBS domain-containing protein
MNASKTVESTIRDTQGVVTISQQMQISEAAQIMSHYKVGALLVIADDNDDVLVGIVTEQDLLDRANAIPHKTNSQSVQHIMTTDIIFCDSNTPVRDAWEIMKKNNILHLPVVSDGRITKMLSLNNLSDSPPVFSAE